jgi:hypothetical protein
MGFVFLIGDVMGFSLTPEQTPKFEAFKKKYGGKIYPNKAELKKAYEEKDQELKMLEDIYFNRVPVNVRQKWANTLDKDRANEIDPLFLEQVTGFLHEGTKQYQDRR